MPQAKGHASTSPPQAHPGTSAVPRDELDTGGFQGGADVGEVAGVGDAGAAFEVGDGAPGDAGGLGEVRLGPVQQGAGGAALFRGDGHSAFVATNRLTAQSRRSRKVEAVRNVQLL